MTQNVSKPMIKFSRNSYLLELLNKLIPQIRTQVKYTIFHTTQLFV